MILVGWKMYFIVNCHNTKCSLRPHEVNLSFSKINIERFWAMFLRGFEKCKIPSNLWNRRCLCQTPGISAWGSLEDSRWTWHREQSWIPGSQYDHPARQSNYVTFNISSMFFFCKIFAKEFFIISYDFHLVCIIHSEYVTLKLFCICPRVAFLTKKRINWAMSFLLF